MVIKVFDTSSSAAVPPKNLWREAKIEIAMAISILASLQKKIFAAFWRRENIAPFNKFQFGLSEFIIELKQILSNTICNSTLTKI